MAGSPACINQVFKEALSERFWAVKRIFPVYDKFFKNLTFTVFYARFEDFKNVLKFEVPYKLSQEEITSILESIKGICTDGYPYLLKKAHNEVVLKNRDINSISRIINLNEPDLRTGREMLWPEQLEDVLVKLLQ